MVRQIDGQIDRQKVRLIDRWLDIQIDGLDRQIDRWIDGQIDRQIDILCKDRWEGREMVA